jgi:drug/metabolite transporter (DMT)-like permease
MQIQQSSSAEIRLGVAQMSAAMMILGTIGWFVVRSEQPALDVVFWRCVFGAATLLIVCASLGLFRAHLTLRKIGIASIGGVAIVLNWVLLFSAYKYASITVATAIYNTQPFMLIGFGALLFEEKPNRSKFTWLGMAFIGLLLITFTKSEMTGLGSHFALGVVMALGAAFFWAVASVSTKSLSGTPPHLIALIQVCIGMVMLVPFTHFTALPQSLETWAMLATVGIVHTGLMYILMYSAVQKLPTHLQGVLSFLYPVVAILVDVLALGHRLQLFQVLGAALILLAAAGMNLGWKWRVRSLFKLKIPFSS